MTGSTTISDDVLSVSPLPSSRKRKRDPTTIAELEVDINAPEPPSKKALRKAKKAKSNKDISLHGTENVDTESSFRKEEAEAEGVPTNPVPKRSGFGIWIGNLPWSVSKINVRNFITTHTNITDAQITRLHMPAPREGSRDTPRQHVPKAWNKGFAYVDFSTAAALTQAMALTETLLAGRRLLIKDSKSFEGRPERPEMKDGDGAAKVSAGKPASKRIFVGNLGFDTEEEDLRAHFARCGPVAHVHMATFEDSGKCKGFAWVEFDDLAAGEAAVRGWVDLDSAQSSEEGEEEQQEDVQDEQSKIQSEDEDDGDKAVHQEGPATPSTKKEKRVRKKRASKPRKWWVNKIHGRLLRMEFAEDKAVRYKKRYGSKGAVRKEGSDSKANDVPLTAVSAEVDMPEKANPTTPLLTSASSDPISQVAYRASHPPRPSASFRHPSKHTAEPARVRKPTGSAARAKNTPAPRLTGGIVASEGKKIIFT